jgi:hypothetical protein
VQRLRVEYWQQVTQIAPENLVFLDQMGVQLGCSTTHARATPGQRIYDLKPFYREANVSVVGAMSLTKVLGVISLNGPVNGAAFEVYVRDILVPQLWPQAVVVMHNLAAHKLKAIVRAIEAVGARVLYLSPYFP